MLFDFSIVVANTTDTDANLPAGANKVEVADEEALDEAQEDAIEDSSDEDARDPYNEALVLCGVKLQCSHQAITAQGFAKVRD
jgi:hypothetical protein